MLEEWLAKGVFVHRPDSRYDDLPERQYQFPTKRYYKLAKTFENDWIVYYEPRGGGGRLGYNAVARVQKVIPDPNHDMMHLAIIEPGSFLPLDEFVPYRGAEGYWETGLNKPDGSLNQGWVQWSVRTISDTDFGRILARGFPQDDDVLPRTDEELDPRYSELQEEASPFYFDYDRPRVDQLISKPLRSRVFRRHVLSAYDARCAFTGFKFINGGGRAEVEAAHIIPVEKGGSDSVRNGLALSGTVHWMFDRGLLSLDDDDNILVSRHVNDTAEVDRILCPSRKAQLPSIPSLRPHPQFLSWHREHCFKQ